MTDYIPSHYRFVSSITITAGGTGYNNVPTITVSGGGGTGGQLTVFLSSVCSPTDEESPVFDEAGIDGPACDLG